MGITMILGLLTINKKKTGSEAVEEALAGFEEIINGLNRALEETNEERVEAVQTVEAAIQERSRIETVLDKGHNFLEGLKTLLQS